MGIMTAKEAKAVSTIERKKQKSPQYWLDLLEMKLNHQIRNGEERCELFFPYDIFHVKKNQEKIKDWTKVLKANGYKVDLIRQYDFSINQKIIAGVRVDWTFNDQD